MNPPSLLSKTSCPHTRVSCLNPYELIRKYRCDACSAVMMCACDESFGRRFLAHQLTVGRELQTQTDVPVDLGFVASTCPECRGLPALPTPLAESFGRTSKIRRYYWRELFFLTTPRQAEWAEANVDASSQEHNTAMAAIEAEALEEIKARHAAAPKYVFSEDSQAEVLHRYDVDVQAIDAIYSDQPAKGAMIVLGDETVSPEAYVSHLYQSQGWSVMPLESMPFHALFGVMMWLVIQDASDPLVQLVGFGDRHAYETSRKKVPIWTFLPDDFGSTAYAQRRQQQIARHLGRFPDDRDGMLWLFDYQRPMSSDLRQYLWAHREDDVDRARRLIEVLAPAQIVAILRYLVYAYWDRYLGWPDLLLHRDEEILLVEVKSSSDRLSTAQKEWIAGNHEHLRLPFRLVKLHRKAN